MKNPLLDYDFLKELDSYPHKTVYAKIILLNFDELPVQEIQGRISAGNVNIDGASAIRRTCSLTMITNEEQIDNIYWGLKNKFKLEIGLENNINFDYPDIIWFKQGLFVITDLNESLNASNHTINISGKDKGCLLNGEIGGSIPSTTNFSKMDINEINGNNIITTTIDIPIKEIIKNAIISFGGESLHNIVINDIDNYGMELMSYKGDSPLYMLFNETAKMVTNMTFSGKNRKCKYWDSVAKEWKINESMNFTDSNFIFNSYVDQMATENRTFVWDNQTQDFNYSVIKFKKDESVGYRKTELIYPGDLIANAGESVTSVLDKIKNMFSTFEYFYDIDGKFIFQKKKTYVNTSWNNVKVSEDEIYVDAAALTSQTIYSFNDNQMLTAISKQPSLTNLKNDFAIQGTRKSATGTDILIHMRYAISDKPVYYKPIRFKTNGELDTDADPIIANEFDDYVIVKSLTEEQFNTDYNNGKYYYIRTNSNTYKKASQFHVETTYYELEEEREYKNIERVDWREIIYQMALDYYKYNQRDDFLSLIATNNPIYFPTGKTGYEMFYTDLQGFWRQIYNPEAIGEKGNYIELPVFGGTKERYDTFTGFNENVEKNPAVLNFWFDFMDTTGEMGQYSIQTIGHRPKAINDSKTAAIYYKQVPQVLFVSGNELQNLNKENLKDFYNLSGYNFIQISPAYEKYFSISSRQKSAQDTLDDLLYQHLYCSENITLTSIPIYYLQPNNRIFVRDKKTNTNGEYLINKITIPLTYNGTSSINAQLAPNRLY